MAYDLIKISALPETTPDESQDIVIGEGDYAKRINYGDVKADMVGTEPLYTTDTEPYLMRQTAHFGVVGKCALNKLVGGSIGWNQLAHNFTARSETLGITIAVDNTNGSITASGTATATNTLYFMTSLSVIQGHKYLLTGSKGKGTLNIYASSTTKVDSGNGTIFNAPSSVNNAQLSYGFTSGQTYNETLYPQFTDLTQAFGSTIADYVYGLEQATAGAGVAWLSEYIDLGTYHAYDAGSIQSVEATAHVTTGKNLMSQQTDGIIPCFLPKGAHICASCTTPTGATPNLNYYDANRNRIDYWPLTQTYSGGLYRSFVVAQDAYYIAFTNNTAMNKQLEFGSSPTAYEPYTEHVYSLGSDTLRGIPQLVNNKLAFDGDEKAPDGTITRKYGIVDLGTLNWAYNGRNTADTANIFYVSFSSARAVANIICGSKFVPRAVITGTWENVGLNEIEIDYYKYIVAGSSESTAAAFKTAMSGIYLVYEKATPTTESSTSYQKVQTIDADGTESFTTSTPVPVGHETQTPDNILAALEWLGE